MKVSADEKTKEKPRMEEEKEKKKSTEKEEEDRKAMQRKKEMEEEMQRAMRKLQEKWDQEKREEEEKAKREEEERKKREEEIERKRKQEEIEKKRKEEEAERKRKQEEMERKKKEEEAERKRKEEAERQKKQEEAQRQIQEIEKRLEDEEEDDEDEGEEEKEKDDEEDDSEAEKERLMKIETARVTAIMKKRFQERQAAEQKEKVKKIGHSNKEKSTTSLPRRQSRRGKKNEVIELPDDEQDDEEDSSEGRRNEPEERGQQNHYSDFRDNTKASVEAAIGVMWSKAIVAGLTALLGSFQEQMNENVYSEMEQEAKSKRWGLPGVPPNAPLGFATREVVPASIVKMDHRKESARPVMKRGNNSEARSRSNAKKAKLHHESKNNAHPVSSKHTLEYHETNVVQEDQDDENDAANQKEVVEDSDAEKEEEEEEEEEREREEDEDEDEEEDSADKDDEDDDDDDNDDDDDEERPRAHPMYGIKSPIKKSMTIVEQTKHGKQNATPRNSRQFEDNRVLVPKIMYASEIADFLQIIELERKKITKGMSDKKIVDVFKTKIGPFLPHKGSLKDKHQYSEAELSRYRAVFEYIQIAAPNILKEYQKTGKGFSKFDIVVSGAKANSLDPKKPLHLACLLDDGWELILKEFVNAIAYIYAYHRLIMSQGK